jgi:hypothetical protein
MRAASPDARAKRRARSSHATVNDYSTSTGA